MSSQEIQCVRQDIAEGVVLITAAGRLDGFGSKKFAEVVEQALENPAVLGLAIDMAEVSYLSSAAVRVFTVALKQLKARNGLLALCHLQRFCKDVFEISGMGSMFPIVATRGEAITLCLQRAGQERVLSAWNELEMLENDHARVRVIPGDGDARGVVEILGHVKEVLLADLGEDQVASKTFSETEFSIGCGALGDQLDDYYPIMGEMITIGGTMVWLPTDGHDTPDFLIPRRASQAITIRTGFNASILGKFDEFFLVQAKTTAGIAIDQLYRLVFDTAKDRRANFRGVASLAGRAEFTEVYGAGIRKSPIRKFKPANGETILHPSNLHEWFCGDRTPRLRDVTGLLCGIGVDLTADLSSFDSAHVDAAFYRHPDNTAGKPHLLHNHAVFFTKQPWRDPMIDLAAVIQDVVDNGDFKDMRHLLDQSKISRAFLGVSYTQEIRHVRAGQPAG